MLLKLIKVFEDMKNIVKVVLVGVFIGIYMPAWSQLLIGVKAGFQMSKIDYNDKDYYDEYEIGFKPGYNAGAVLNYKVSNTFSLHTELFYSSKGKVEKKDQYNVKNVVSYNYLDLPLMLRVSHHGKIKKLRVEYYFNTGPSFAYWLGGKGKLHSGELSEYIDTNQLKYKIDFKEASHYDNLYVEEPNRLQMELNLGGGFIFDMARGQKLMIDMRYAFGIGQTFLGTKAGGDFGLIEYHDNLEGVNHVISLSAAYLYEIDVRRILKKGKIR